MSGFSYINIYFEYFGVTYSTCTKEMNIALKDGEECVFHRATELKGRVIIPQKVKYYDKELTVVCFGRTSMGRYREEPSDKRIKDINKYPSVWCYYSPFTGNYGNELDVKKAFPSNTTVTYVKLPDTIRRLLGGAFARCAALEEIELSKNIKEIPRDCFSGCSALKSIQLHEGITKIGRFAFSGCTALKKITIPSSVTEIGMHAFGGNIEEVDILNDEGAVMMYPNSFRDSVKINYLGKKGAKKAAAPKTEKATSKTEKKEPVEKVTSSKKTKTETKPTSRPTGDYKKSAVSGGYTIGITADNKVVVSKGSTVCDNAKGALREISEKVGFKFETSWTTQQFGSKLVDFINKK